MKKLISIVCVLAMVLGVVAVSAVSGSAAEPAQTAVDVVKGDEITYILTLGGIEEPVVGCDFSVYYDSEIFDKVSIADFNDETSEDEWTPTINPNLDGHIIGNWSILKGVDFSKDRHFLTVKLKAKADGTGHISYFIRYLYDNNIFNSDDRPQITDYKFTCDVLKNGEPVLEDAQPELNTTETQKSGLFVNSVTGDSNDADANIPGTVVKKNNTNSNITPGGNNNNAAQSGGNADNNSVSSAADNNNQADNNAGGSDNNKTSAASKVSDDKKTDDAKTGSDDAKTVQTNAAGETVVATDASGKPVEAAADNNAAANTTGTKANTNKSGSSPVLWIIIALVVLGGGGAAAYFYMKKKPSAYNAQTDGEDAPEPDDASSDTEE